MQNLAYKIEFQEVEELGRNTASNPVVCVACGEALTVPNIEPCSWQSWGAFWDGIGPNSVELLCGACGEYLSGFFDDRK